MAESAEQLAAQLWLTTRLEGQCARRIPDNRVAAEVRNRVRQLARKDGVKIRTARVGDSVVIVRLDAEVWQQDAATMRKKLTPQ